MKQISARVFFTVLWRGVCQVLGWFFGLFGYKRDGKFAKCVWGLFATSAAIVMSFIALALVCVFAEEGYKRYFRGHQCEYTHCYHSQYVSRNIYFHNTEDGKGYIFNKVTKEITLRRVTWIAKPLGNDSLVCFSTGRKRGYFNKNTGRVVIEPKYDHAWVFSDGLASVEEGGYIKFIDGTGKVVIDKKMAYIPHMEGYVFHSGYCVVDTDDGEQCGLIDKKGNIVLPFEYSYIRPTNDFKLWRIQKDDMEGVLDSCLKPMIPLSVCSIYIGDGTIDKTLPDHTILKFDMEGNLIDDCYITCFRMLEYEKEEIVYRKNVLADDSDGDWEEEDSYHPKATARLRVYIAGNQYEGLMTADGHRVTKPLYENIQAIAYDLYLCTTTNYDKVIVNGKGEIVR